MSKISKNYIKKKLKINTDNFGFSFSHYKNNSSNYISDSQRAETSPQLNTNINTNNNINNQYNNNNINIINININSNCNFTKNKINISNPSTERNEVDKIKKPLINYLRKKVNLNSSNSKKKYYEKKIVKLDTSSNTVSNVNKANVNKKIIKDYNISYTSRPQTESNVRKNSYKFQFNKKPEGVTSDSPKHIIISYFDVKNILENNIKNKFKKREKIPKYKKNQKKKKDENNEKKIFIKNNYSNLNNKLKNKNHQSEENLLKFIHNNIYNNKNIKQSKSFLNKDKFKNKNICNEMNPLGYLKTNSNNPKEYIKRIKHYYTNSEMMNQEKKIKQKIVKHDKNLSLNYNLNPSPFISSYSTNKNPKITNAFFFQKIFFKNNYKNYLNVSNSRTSKSNSNNDINKNNNLSYRSKNKKNDSLSFNISEIKKNSNTLRKNNYLKKFTKYQNTKENIIKKDSSFSLENLFDSEIKINNFKNPEEYHFFYIKVFQASNEISQNFENQNID